MLVVLDCLLGICSTSHNIDEETYVCVPKKRKIPEIFRVFATFDKIDLVFIQPSVVIQPISGGSIVIHTGK
jgi:hypothetical protein